MKLLLWDVTSLRYPRRNVHRLGLALNRLPRFRFFFQLAQQMLIGGLSESLYFSIVSPGHVPVNGRVFLEGLAAAAPGWASFPLTVTPLGRHKRGEWLRRRRKSNFLQKCAVKWGSTAEIGQIISRFLTFVACIFYLEAQPGFQVSFKIACLWAESSLIWTPGLETSNLNLVHKRQATPSVLS